MKKFFAVLLAFLLVSGSAISAFATDDADIGYNNPISDMPLFGEMIFPSNFEITEELMHNLECETLPSLFEKITDNDSSLVGILRFLMLVPLWGYAQITTAL